MISDVVALLAMRPVVSVKELQSHFQLSRDDALALCSDVHAANLGTYRLLKEKVTEAPGQTIHLQWSLLKDDEISPSVALPEDVFGLLSSKIDGSNAAKIFLRPAAAVTNRAYPLGRRTELTMETEQNAVARIPPHLSSSTPDAGAPRKAEEMAAKVLPPACDVKVKVEPATLPVEAATQLPSPANVAATKSNASPRDEKEPSTSAAAKAKPSIFDKMKEAAMTKRERDGDESRKPKRGAEPKKKAPKVAETNSLAKLARASKRKAGSTNSASAPTSRSFLDEDEDEAIDSDGPSNSEAMDLLAEETTQNQQPLFEVAVAATNDEVELCDDAPPLAFQPAVAPAASPRRESTGARPVPAAEQSGVTQSTLGAFFDGAVAAFQRSYAREVQTDMKIEDGEYLCFDIPYYRHRSSGELIDEAEFHRRSSEFMRSRDETQKKSVQDLIVPIEASPKPAVARKKATRPAVLKTVSEEASAVSREKTLLSFFKK